MKDKIKDLPIIPGIGGPQSPIYNVLGDPIGRPDPLTPLGPLSPQPIEGALVRNIQGDVVGQYNGVGKILPPPKFGR